MYYAYILIYSCGVGLSKDVSQRTLLKICWYCDTDIHTIFQNILHLCNLYEMNIHKYYMMMYFLEKRFDYAFFFFAFSMQGYIVCKYDLVFECISLKCLELLSKRNGKSYFIFIPIRDFYFWITLRNALDGSWNQK